MQDKKRLTVKEIFESIQGESSFSGYPCLFVRLSGCNLRCSYCDSQYSYHGGKSYSIDNILQIITDSKINLIEITGGEPLLQKNTIELLEELSLLNNKTILIETNGSFNISDIPNNIITIIDIKCPSSGAFNSFLESNIKYLKPIDEVKFVISNKHDYYWARDFIMDNDLSNKCNHILISPVTNLITPNELALQMVKDGLNARLQLQLHKQIDVL